MPEYTDTPGVYIEEVSYRGKHIVGVSTSTTAFIDVFNKGLTCKATPISSVKELTIIFGLGISTVKPHMGGIRHIIKANNRNLGKIPWVQKIQKAFSNTP